MAARGTTPRRELRDPCSAHCPGTRRASQPLIVHQQVITPDDLETTYGLTGGHILHGEPSLDQLFTMRPMLGWAQYRTPIPDLYLCGSGTHPAAASLPAPVRNASREIVKDLKRR